VRGVVLRKPGDVIIEEREDRRTHRRHHPAGGHLHLRQRPVAVPRRGARGGPSDGARVRRGGRRGRRPGRDRGARRLLVGSFWSSDNTCEICRARYQAYRVNRVLMGTKGTAAPARSHPWEDMLRPRHRTCDRRIGSGSRSGRTGRRIRSMRGSGKLARRSGTGRRCTRNHH